MKLLNNLISCGSFPYISHKGGGDFPKGGWIPTIIWIILASSAIIGFIVWAIVSAL